MKNEKGFTLIEIIVVTTIILLVSTISVVSFFQIKKKLEIKNQREIATLLGAAAEVYLYANENVLDKVLNGCCNAKIPIGLLVSDGLIKKDRLNKMKKKDGSLISLADKVIAKENCGGELAFEFDGTYADNDVEYVCSSKVPKIELEIEKIKKDIASGSGGGSGETNTCQNNKGISNRVYLAGEVINYAGKEWKIISENGTNVTMILNNNYKVGKYGDSLNWKNSTAYTQLNTNFVNENSVLKSSIDNKCIKKSLNSDSYVRLPVYNELSPIIKNKSNTPFWTMSAATNENLILGSSEGSMDKTGNYVLKNYTLLYIGMTRYDRDESPGHRDSIREVTLGNYYLGYDATNEVMQVKYNSNKFNKNNLISTNLGFASTNYKIDGITYYWCRANGTVSEYYSGSKVFIYADGNSCVQRTAYSLAAATSFDVGYRPVISIFKNK